MPNINLLRSPLTCLGREEEGRPVSFSLRPFFNFNPVHSFVSSLAYTRVLRFPPFRLSRVLFFLSTADVSAYIVERRRINSQVLSDTIPRITASCVSFLVAATGPSRRALRAVSRRLKNGKGEKDGGRARLFCARVSQFNDYPLESSQ